MESLQYNNGFYHELMLGVINGSIHNLIKIMKEQFIHPELKIAAINSLSNEDMPYIVATALNEVVLKENENISVKVAAIYKLGSALKYKIVLNTLYSLAASDTEHEEIKQAAKCVSNSKCL